MNRKNNIIMKRQETKKNLLRIVLFLLLLATYRLPLTTAVYAIDNIDREKLTLETSIEQRITAALSKLLDQQDFIIIVKIEPIIEKISETKPEERIRIEPLEIPEEKKPVKEYILPGVPTKKNLGDEDNVQRGRVQVVMPSLGKEPDILKLFVKRITVTVKFDNDIPDAVVEEAKKIIAGLVDIIPDRGDILIVEKTKLYKKQTPWWQTFADFPTMLWFLGIILFALFLFGPLNIFFKHLLRTLSTKPAAQQPLDSILSRVPQPGQGPGSLGGFGSSSVTMSLDDGKSSRPKLFSFITMSNLKNLAYLLKDESPERAALVLSYLNNEWASLVMSQLPAALQSRVAVELSNVKQLDPDDVEVMEIELKKKIDYLIGGYAQIVEMCDRSDKKTRENILSALSLSNPELVEQVKLQMLDINDLYFIDSAGLRVLFREISLPSWAIGLKAAKGVTRDKILKTLPTGASEMLKQEIELNQTVHQAKIDEEERNIVAAMRKLRGEGIITIMKGQMPEETSETVTGTEAESETETEKKNETREGRLAKIREKLKKERGG